MKERFTILDFEKRYPSEDACLDEVFDRRYGHFSYCPECGKEFKFYRVRGRKCYSCQYCSHQIHPLAGTIFHKSDTDLRKWFYAIFLFCASKNGVSGKELERQLGVTYKTAWRMAKKIRELFAQDDDNLSGIVEVDETYVGGKRRGKRGRGADGKSPVVGIVERGGCIKAYVTEDTKRVTLTKLIVDNVDEESTLMTDEYPSYKRISLHGFKHEKVNHGSKEYVRGSAHTNTVEGFWSQLKRSINGTYHSVSPKYLQQYVNEFAFRYNFRHLPSPLFEVVLQRVVMP